jgi:hypothetical protein
MRVFTARVYAAATITGAATASPFPVCGATIAIGFGIAPRRDGRVVDGYDPGLARIAAIAATERSTSASVVDQFETAIRM